MTALSEVRKVPEHVIDFRKKMHIPGIIPQEFEDFVTDKERVGLVLNPFLQHPKVATHYDSLKGEGRTFAIGGRFKKSWLKPPIVMGFRVDQYVEGKKVGIETTDVRSPLLRLSSGFDLHMVWTYQQENDGTTADFSLQCDASGIARSLINKYFPGNQLESDIKMVMGRIKKEILEGKSARIEKND